MIYIFDKLDEISEKQYRSLFDRLPPSRKQKATVLEGNNRKIAICEYFLLKNLLNLSDSVDLLYNANGKPLLQGYNFNASHCDGIICIAIGQSQIGVDIEKQREYDANLARYVLNAEELHFVESQANKDDLFTKLWTQKEATLKCLGLALNTPLKDLVDTKRFSYTFYKYKDCQVCQCVLNSQPNTLHQRTDLIELDDLKFIFGKNRRHNPQRLNG